MAIEPITAALEISSKIIDRLWPDPTKAAEAKLELFRMQQNGELQQITGQLEINKVEAANTSVFVSGWRPAVGWVCVLGLGYSFVGQPLLNWVSAIMNFANPPLLDTSTLITILGGMLGLGGLRTVEKINRVDRK